MFKNSGCIQTLKLSISLQLNHRRLAGRGHKPRPQPPRGRPAGPTRGTSEKKMKAFIACIYTILSAIERGGKRIEMPQIIENLAEKPNYKKFILQGLKTDPTPINITKRDRY